ncbi:division/cell wall cluster transcriptional repressor MraZ [candidate division WOR-3 bacterium]|nr:division/cell wall cluster transcriptional repressor MraZ [candidate division WOR-3 bacterium]
MDAKGRLAIPGQFRSQLDPNDGGAFVLQKGLGGTIEVYPLSAFQEFCEQDLNRLPKYQPRSRIVRFMRFGFGSEVALDSQNRVLIPRWMLDDAGITNEAVVVGNGEFFQVWEPKRFEEFSRQAAERYEDDLVALERQGWTERTDNAGTADAEVP